MLSKFISYLEDQVKNHSIYIWGGQGEQGQTINEAWIRKKENSALNAARAIAYWKRQVKAGYGDVLRAFDCSGLGTYFFVNEGLLKKDTTANGLLSICAIVTKDELLPGDFAFKLNSKGKAYHVGYVVDNAHVIEAKGRATGVTRSKLSGWDVYGRPPFFKATSSPLPSPRVLKLTKPYMQGADVVTLQTALKKRGYAIGTLDGVFGPHKKSCAQIPEECKAHY